MPKIFDSGFSNWTEEQLPNLSGKCYFITGGNSGIGFEAAKMLAGRGAKMFIGARNKAKGEAAVQALQDAGGDAALIIIDLADSASIKAAVQTLSDHTGHIDALINNAGIMQTPELKTKDGYEMQLGTNHLGHFLLTGLAYPLVKAAENGRIVTVSSIAHKSGKLNFDDLMSREDYSASRAYCQSKLANLVFALELNRRLVAAGSDVGSYACHPGYSDTALQSTGPTSGWKRLYKITNALIAQPAYKGALPTVLCAAGGEAKAGGYYGPTKMGDYRGPVSDCTAAGRALDRESGTKLWAASEKLTGLDFDAILSA